MQVNFGIHIAPQFGYSYENVQKIVTHAEKNDYNLLTIGDHLFLDENSQIEIVWKLGCYLGPLQLKPPRFDLAR